MKKLIISSVLGIMVAASTAYGQGWIIFGAGTKSAWDDTVSVGPKLGSSGQDDFALLFAPSTVTSASVDAILAVTPTNNSTVGTGALVQQPFSYATAWSDIMNDANFTFVESNAQSFAAVAAGGNNGAYNYNGGTLFETANLAASTTYSMFVIGWNTGGGAYTTPQAAQAAGAAVGWTGVFQYTSVVAPPAGSETSGAGAGNQFGVGYYPVPEPTTLALAGLGGISMLFLRRRKA